MPEMEALYYRIRKAVFCEFSANGVIFGQFIRNLTLLSLMMETFGN